MAGLSEAFARCEELTRERAGNFHHAFRLLPADLKRDLSVAYAYFRLIDDIVDEPGDTDAKAASLDRAAAGLRACGESSCVAVCGPALPVRTSEPALPTPPSEPGFPEAALVPAPVAAPAPEPMPPSAAMAAGAHVFQALGDVMARRRLVEGELAAVIDGARRDLRQRRYPTFDDLAIYCYEVAGSVGQVTIRILGCHSPEAMGPARDLGTALQLTNILRDVREDWRQGRLYLPQEDLERFGVTPEAIENGFASAAFAQLVRFEAQRARSLYESGHQLDAHLSGPAAAVPRALALIYGTILKRIDDDPARVLAGRVSLGSVEKGMLAARALVGWGSA